jgi:hypothetical protein
MSERNINDWITGFMELTENSEPPVLYRKWTAISTIASALQRKVKICLGLSLTVYPNLYIVLVGPPSTGKGTAMGYAKDIIKEIPSIRIAAESVTLQSLIRRMKEVNLTDVDPLTGKQHYHSSMTIFSEEFTVFLGFNNHELISALCNWYDCGDKWTYDTIKRDKEEVFGVWVNILGGTTPNAIQASFPPEAIGGGLSSRIIFVNEEKKNKLVIFPAATAAEIELQQYLIRDLEQISLMSGQMQYTEAALSYYADWCIEADQTPPFQDQKFDGYMGRRRNHLNSLAMICSASRKNSLLIDEDDLKRAAKLLSEVEVKMGTIFKGIGSSDISTLINDAVMYIANSQTPDIPLWQFARRFEGDADKYILDRVLRTLEAMKYVNVITRPGADTIISIIGFEGRGK